jgi:hypothetical protein
MRKVSDTLNIMCRHLKSKCVPPLLIAILQIVVVRRYPVYNIKRYYIIQSNTSKKK